LSVRVLLVAGGTGGHLFPALALREALVRRGLDVHVATDERVGRFIEGVPAGQSHIVASASLAAGNPLTMAASLWRLLSGTFAARGLIRRVRPALVVGFGGYPTVPPVVAARLSGLPALVHEQNAVVGRANRLLIRLGAELATGIDNPSGAAAARRVHAVGNPVRDAVRKAAKAPYHPPRAGGPLNLLVFGGSQGARVFSTAMPAAIDHLPEAVRKRLAVVQQCRAEDLHEVREAYDRRRIAAELKPFFNDMADRIAAAHLVVSRAGASTVSELAVIGRPAILVPYPHALDHDQAANAEALRAAGGAVVHREAELDAERLAAAVADLFSAPDVLGRMAASAKSAGRPDAVDKLADLVERMAREQ